MKPTKRHTDPLGRSARSSTRRLYTLCVTLAIIGSAWPIQARSIRAAFDTLAHELEREGIGALSSELEEQLGAPSKGDVARARKAWPKR